MSILPDVQPSRHDARSYRHRQCEDESSAAHLLHTVAESKGDGKSRKRTNLHVANFVGQVPQHPGLVKTAMAQSLRGLDRVLEDQEADSLFLPGPHLPKMSKMSSCYRFSPKGG